MNNLNLIEIFSIIIIHFIGDFVLQTDKQAKGKSKNWADLLGHTIIYSCTWILLPLILLCFNITVSHKIIYLIPITFVLHTLTDYFTSRLNSKLWSQNKVHLFFVSVGFDQILHYLQLFLTYYLLIKI